MSEAAATAGLSRLLSDERLTRRAVSGDERAFAAIFRRYHQPLFRFCLAIVGNPEDAQDALQNTMMKVLRALPGEERKIELKPWLYRIAHNESIDLLRRRRETRELDAEQVAPGYALAEDAATRERLRRLLADLRELPERQREVLVMRELGGLDFEEIGSALQTSGPVARQTLYEARQSLRQMEEGREMSCEAVMRALSDGDGRVTRRRDVRAHLRSCAECRAFRDGIKDRQHDFAALSPLPAVVAAGMLQGLVGGSSAASGGGLAAVLGGGAAQGVGASAVAKGVATVAVTAAIGVTAADQTGVIQVLPGSGNAKSGESAPANHGHGGSSGPQVDGGVNGGKGSAGAGAGGKRAADGKAGSHGQAAKEQPGSKGYGPDASHPSGQGHEKQHPPAASHGQETADAAKPPPRESPSAVEGDGGQPAPPPTPSRPEPAPSPPAKEASASPPAPAPPAPPQAQVPAPSTQQSTAEAVAPESSEGAGKDVGKGSEKKP